MDKPVTKFMLVSETCEKTVGMEETEELSLPSFLLYCDSHRIDCEACAASELDDYDDIHGLDSDGMIPILREIGYKGEQCIELQYGDADIVTSFRLHTIGEIRFPLYLSDLISVLAPVLAKEGSALTGIELRHTDLFECIQLPLGTIAFRRLLSGFCGKGRMITLKYYFLNGSQLRELDEAKVAITFVNCCFEGPGLLDHCVEAGRRWYFKGCKNLPLNDLVLFFTTNRHKECKPIYKFYKCESNSMETVAETVEKLRALGKGKYFFWN